jgi:drug efflux transport system ATP-binding protein
MFAVETSGLIKSFDGTEAVRSVDLRINKGDVFGLIGPDGAGKTTLMRLLTGVMTPDAGSVKIFGVDALGEKEKAGSMLGYMSQRFSLYEDLTVMENLEFFADIKYISKNEFLKRKDMLLKFTHLEQFTHRLAGLLSGGMKQKLGLACTLIHQPGLLILDEPTTGVDPVSRREFWQILDTFIHQGMTVLVSTPYMDEADRCTEIGLMNDGRILIIDTPTHIKSLMQGIMLEVVLKNPFRARQVLSGHSRYGSIHILGDRMHIYTDKKDTGYMKEVGSLLQNAGIPVDDMRYTPPALEDVFVFLIEKARHG